MSKCMREVKEALDYRKGLPRDCWHCDSLVNRVCTDRPVFDKLCNPHLTGTEPTLGKKETKGEKL